MACKPFTITLNKDMNFILGEVRGKATEMGISFRGNAKNGDLEGKGLYARYTVSGKEVTVTIHSLPIFKSCQKAEIKIRKAFES